MAVQDTARDRWFFTLYLIKRLGRLSICDLLRLWLVNSYRQEA